MLSLIALGAAAVIGGIVTAVVVSEERKKKKAKECKQSSDCQAGEVCYGGACTSSTGGSCTKHEQCPDKYRCYNGKCEFGCRGDADCDGQHCDLTTGTCSAKPAPETECAENVDCPVDSGCYQGKCYASGLLQCSLDKNCPPGWGCYNGWCKPGCSGSYDCPKGTDNVQLECESGKCVTPKPPVVEGCTDLASCGYSKVCDKSTGKCVDPQGAPCAANDDCPKDMRCASGACKKGCWRDVSCPIGSKCDVGTGQCYVDPSQTVCGTSADCPSGSACMVDHCVPKGSDCINDGECPPEWGCFKSHCKAHCESNNDCYQGYQCIAEKCVLPQAMQAVTNRQSGLQMLARAGMPSVSKAGQAPATCWDGYTAQRC